MNFFSQLKFKAGYGQTGNDRIPRTARFNFLTDQDASYFFDGQTIQGQIPPSLGANPNLFWEVTEQLNLGVDVGLFDGRMSLAIEAYQKDTKDLLINADAAPSQTVTNVYLNTGHVRNRGLEITLSSTNINTKDFSWTSDFNISFNRNTIESLPEGKPIFGRPNYYQRLSTNQFLGDEKYKDLNGDGQITAADKTVIGNGLPVHFGGFTNTFKYKNFELSTFLQWSYGNDVLNANRLVFENMTVPNQNQLATTLNRWTPENQNTTMHRALGQGVSVVNSLIMPGVDYSAYPIHRIMSLGINVSF